MGMLTVHLVLTTYNCRGLGWNIRSFKRTVALKSWHKGCCPLKGIPLLDFVQLFENGAFGFKEHFRCNAQNPLCSRTLGNCLRLCLGAFQRSIKGTSNAVTLCAAYKIASDFQFVFSTLLYPQFLLFSLQRCVVVQEVFPDGLIAQDGRLRPGGNSEIKDLPWDLAF